VSVTFGALPSALRSSLTLTGPAKTSCPGGTARASVAVLVRSATGSPLPGRLVTLAGGKGSRASVRPSSAITAANGAATFLVSDASRQLVSFGASDPLDGVALATHLPVSFPAPRHC
jgi:hypothetical protein